METVGKLVPILGDTVQVYTLQNTKIKALRLKELKK